MFPLLHPHVTDTEKDEEEEDYKWIDDLTEEERGQLIKDYAILWKEEEDEKGKPGLITRVFLRACKFCRTGC